ncbi:trafficking protein particle complex subunit 8 isoform X2 [Orussus abietinus]|uniref:trafficking protein particle complex subunit 8 isoform X2 n=1 Tax=Orussus abietinus TaxID=222816 RepID=UPI000625072B|nr:trafficking protein particle complex subunit 8 isoform X2 [Orussus abietinus]
MCSDLGHFKDPQGTMIVVRNLHVSVQDVSARPPQPTLARKMLNESVSSAPCERTTIIQVGSTDLEIPVSVPWFEAWREMFLNVQFPSDHEFTKHFLACLIVVSTADENPLEKIQHMGAQLHQSVPGKLPKWFNNNALRYYVLIHDAVSDDKFKAETVFTDMKNIYGINNCFLLQMNSRQPGITDDNAHLPDPWSQFLVKHADIPGNSDQGSSPRTPADTGGVSAMPNEVSSEPDKSSQAGTPVALHNPTLASPDVTDRISLSSEISVLSSAQLEVGQEAVPVIIHPLSPNEERVYHFNSVTHRHPMENSAPLNDNVWADSPSHPVPQHGARLSSNDLERLRTLITEFCIKSLLPYVEKQIGLLNDVISNKKGVSRSLFSATKRWFGTNKPGAPGSTSSNAVIYATDSPELQLRRLGDLCFMFGDYPLAYQAYHSAKRDFAADQAWLYYAGALEMAALSAFMQGEMSRKTIEYMDDAILTYQNSCKMPQFATRATLLSAECLKDRGLYGEAAKQLIRMTSEDSDLRSALLLEQASYCFLNLKMTRKYAFHAVLAGHRYSKAGQRKHSLRCYQQAYQVYRGKDWTLAEDHIHFTIGRQAASLKLVLEATKAFEKLLSVSSKQPAPQQAAFLREFLHTHNVLLQDEATKKDALPVLPLPLIDGNRIKVLFGPLPTTETGKEAFTPASGVTFDNEDTDEARWLKLEETLITEAQGVAPMIFKPSKSLYSDRTNNSIKPYAVLDEPVHFSVELHNPLHIPLSLSDVKLLWLFTRDGETTTNEKEVNNSVQLPVDTRTIEAIVLQPTCKQCVLLSLTPRRTGDIKVLGLSYNLCNPGFSTVDQPVANPSIAIAGKRLFEVRGPKLKNIKEKPGMNMYEVDYRLEMNVVPKAPFMQVFFGKMSPEMLCGEMQRVTVKLKNVGNSTLSNIHVGSSDSRLFSWDDHSENANGGVARKLDNPVMKIKVPESYGHSLEAGGEFRFTLWIRAPHKKGNHRLDLLFYYENPEPKSVPKYRVVRHTWQLTLLDSVQISTNVIRSGVCKDDSPTLNMLIRVKNSNEVHDLVMNEISLTRVSLRSDSWSLSGPIALPSNVNIQPQEMFHLLLKLRRSKESDSEFSDVSLTTDGDKSITDSPYIDFVQRRNIPSMDASPGESQLQLQPAIDSSLAVAVKLNSILILRWTAKVTERGVATRHATGQHHIDIEFLNRLYKHPEVSQTDRIEYSGRLKIFGPDRDVPDSKVPRKDELSELDCCKSLLSYTLRHSRRISHSFQKSRICIVPVSINLQNHSNSKIDVMIDTKGTSSQSTLNGAKSQLYSPEASTFFRYVCHTSINCEIESYGHCTLQLHAAIASPGTYDLASRVDVSVKTVNSNQFVPQNWHMESVCIVCDDTT